MEKLLLEDMSGCLPEQLVDDMTALEDSRQYSNIVLHSNQKNSQLRSNVTRTDVSNGWQATSTYGWEGGLRKIANHTDGYSSSYDMEWIARGFGAACMLDHASVDGAKHSDDTQPVLQPTMILQAVLENILFLLCYPGCSRFRSNAKQYCKAAVAKCSALPAPLHLPFVPSEPVYTGKMQQRTGKRIMN